MRHFHKERVGECRGTCVYNVRGTVSLYRVSRDVRALYLYETFPNQPSNIAYGFSWLIKKIAGYRTFARRLRDPTGGACARNPDCIDIGPVPLLKNIRRGLIDPDTPSSAKTKTAADGTKLRLVVCCVGFVPTIRPLSREGLISIISFLMSSILLVELSMKVMILTGKRWISGTG